MCGRVKTDLTLARPFSSAKLEGEYTTTTGCNLAKTKQNFQSDFNSEMGVSPSRVTMVAASLINLGQVSQQFSVLFSVRLHGLTQRRENTVLQFIPVEIDPL